MDKQPYSKVAYWTKTFTYMLKCTLIKYNKTHHFITSNTCPLSKIHKHVSKTKNAHRFINREHFRLQLSDWLKSAYRLLPLFAVYISGVWFLYFSYIWHPWASNLFLFLLHMSILVAIIFNKITDNYNINVQGCHLLQYCFNLLS